MYSILLPPNKFTDAFLDHLFSKPPQKHRSAYTEPRSLGEKGKASTTHTHTNEHDFKMPGGKFSVT